MNKLQQLLEQYETVHPLEKEFICGYHSEIPFCCIMWYLGNWYEFLVQFNEVEIWETSTQTEIEGISKFELITYWEKDNIWTFALAQYVMCPDCIVNCVSQKKKPVRVEINRCNCGD